MTIDNLAVGQFLKTASRDLALYNACRDYAFRFDGENDFDSYTNGELRLLQTLLPNCRIVFDVGANRGEWTETALTLDPTIEVHAFEPSASTFQQLAAKQLGGQVRLNNIGIGAVEEERELYQIGRASQSELRSLYRREGLEDDYKLSVAPDAERVRITTLDAYCASAGLDHIDYLKIDTEGHDLKVLRGAAGLIGRHAIRYIQFEYGMANIDSRDLLKDFFALFAGSRYNLHKVHPDGYSHYPRYNARLENFQYQNWIGVRQE
jgi:FkbM family methyltransferase